VHLRNPLHLYHENLPDGCQKSATLG
jgi:hypothetical protein